MAAPHVAGLAAYLSSRDNIPAGPDLCDFIVQTATEGAVTNDENSTVNLIAYNGIDN